MSEELKPCPFCGGAASLIPSANHSTACAIGCRDDTCPAYECVWDVNKSSAVAAWNRRASPRVEDVRREAEEMFLAPSGQGKYAADWADKPHRVLYDAVNLIRSLAPPSNPPQEKDDE